MTFPSAPTGTTARLATFRPETKLRFDVVGRFSPDGHAVTKPAPAGVTDARFMITADTPDVGTPPWPVTFSARPFRPESGPPVLRVSKIRAGGAGRRCRPRLGAPVRSVAVHRAA